VRYSEVYATSVSGLYAVLRALLTIGIKKAQLSPGLGLKGHQNYKKQPENRE